ncbi:hypothetical protein AB0F88_40160 [Streptosporangium sp. NPDC023963]|uniref:hypothetical protein n=1 Tax=Streptosporangium sp. NPDC023963 TaxID=3155608 RepID=UPI003412A9F6
MALPPPINGTETYLAAVYERLGEVLERIPKRSSPEEVTPADGPKTVELREPTTSTEEPAPEAEALAEPAPPARTTSARKRTNRKGGT